MATVHKFECKMQEFVGVDGDRSFKNKLWKVKVWFDDLQKVVTFFPGDYFPGSLRLTGLTASRETFEASNQRVVTKYDRDTKLLYFSAIQSSSIHSWIAECQRLHHLRQ